jgi:hypothetical protein
MLFLSGIVGRVYVNGAKRTCPIDLGYVFARLRIVKVGCVTREYDYAAGTIGDEFCGIECRSQSLKVWLVRL